MYRKAQESQLLVKRPSKNYLLRGSGSRGAVLVLIISACIDSGLTNTLNNILRALIQTKSNSRIILDLTTVLVGVALPQLFYPLAGWLADARFGRHRVIQTSLWCVWLGQCALSITLLLFQLLQGHSAYYSIFVYGLFPVAFIIINVGLAGFQANIIQFGIDQMVDASGDQMSAFIHWYYWSKTIWPGIISIILGLVLSTNTLYVAGTGINVILLSVALLCWYKLKRWLIIEPPSQNPFKIVYSVIKFASKHNRPIYRSALTYWDDTPPSRLDLGKTKYGGPFSTEEVENVKSFFAITAVLLSLGLYIIADYTLVPSLDVSNIAIPKVNWTIEDVAVFAGNILPVLLLIPAYEIIIYSLLNKYVPTMLKRIGIGILAAIAYEIFFVMVYYYLSENYNSIPLPDMDNNYCFSLNTSHYISAPVPSLLVTVIPLALGTVADLLVYIAALEFICAQSPYNFRGMLIGTFYAIQGLFTTIAMLIAVAVAYGYKQYDGTYGCGNAYYPVMLGIATVGFILYVVVGRRYKGRERDEHIDHHIIAENYYTCTSTGPIQ